MLAAMNMAGMTLLTGKQAQVPTEDYYNYNSNVGTLKTFCLHQWVSNKCLWKVISNCESAIFEESGY